MLSPVAAGEWDRVAQGEEGGRCRPHGHFSFFLSTSVPSAAKWVALTTTDLSGHLALSANPFFTIDFISKCSSSSLGMISLALGYVRKTHIPTASWSTMALFWTHHFLLWRLGGSCHLYCRIISNILGLYSSELPLTQWEWSKLSAAIAECNLGAKLPLVWLQITGGNSNE